MASDIPEKRRYGGASFEDRQADRRERLIAAAIEVFGRWGREGATVAAICAEAGLTARYFYESFPNREALFIAAYQAVQAELLTEMAKASGPDPVRAALTGFYAGLAAHPGLAKVFLLDAHGREPDMQAAGEETAKRLAEMFAPGVTSMLTLAGMRGAVIQIARTWIAGGFADPVETVVETALAYARASADVPKGSTRPA
ncbi:MAG: TetR/AcrR family transcriptional regulator [Alphaproteobacteria bacterium]|nr:TetR/AcrR family transcriptional regulator [Alphaproteobacteria bacterium]MBL6938418.1 TetR/AcrR family transcriptional regulator [Alphaproteobacteria bacterium]MBL7096477.1 TetR/AcrR family transcriptional regulator [Alphaproteobacteria bacterium]